MARFYGTVAYAVTKQTSPGVWTSEIDDSHKYYGDVIVNSRKWNENGNVNDNLAITNRISIVADPFAYENCNAIKWVEYMGTKWKASSIDVEYPRLVITLGDVWNA